MPCLPQRVLSSHRLSRHEPCCRAPQHHRNLHLRCEASFYERKIAPNRHVTNLIGAHQTKHLGGTPRSAAALCCCSAGAASLRRRARRSQCGPRAFHNVPVGPRHRSVSTILSHPGFAASAERRNVPIVNSGRRRHSATAVRQLRHARLSPAAASTAERTLTLCTLTAPHKLRCSPGSASSAATDPRRRSAGGFLSAFSIHTAAHTFRTMDLSAFFLSIDPCIKLSFTPSKFSPLPSRRCLARRHPAPTASLSRAHSAWCAARPATAALLIPSSALLRGPYAGHFAHRSEAPSRRPCRRTMRTIRCRTTSTTKHSSSTAGARYSAGLSRTCATPAGSHDARGDLKRV